MSSRGHYRFKPLPLNESCPKSRSRSARNIDRVKQPVPVWSQHTIPLNPYVQKKQSSIRLSLILPNIIAVILFFFLLGTGTLDNALLWPRSPKTVVFPGDHPSSQTQKASLDSPLLNLVPNKAAFTTHRVSDGETIARIAYRYGLSPVTLVSVNILQSPDDIKKGKRLIIPYRDGLRYTVKPDETLSDAIKRLQLPEKIQVLPDGGLFVPGEPGLDALPASFRQKMFVKPVEGRVIVPFGYSIDRLTGISWQSNGIDIAALKDSTVLSARQGTVLRTGRHSSYGFYVILEHDDGWLSFYAYLGRIDVAPGDTVDRGVSIGISGQSGTAHSPRVHFALFHNGKPVDPFGYL